MAYDFDCYIDRTQSECAKWKVFDSDVLPLWVADMDFRSPEPVIQALRERVEHGVFGYPAEPPELRPVVIERLRRLYDWEVDPDSLVFVPGVVSGFNLACQGLCKPGDGLLIQTPVYGPIFAASENAQMKRQTMELTCDADGCYTVDLDLMERTIDDSTRMFLLCNPHNPVGRVFTRQELEDMAAVCERHDLIICSDEIHAELLFSGNRHIPIGALSPELARRTVTLLAPSKTFNIAGLHCSVAVIPDPEIRKRFQAARRGIMPGVTIFAYVAALAAYRDGQPWLDAMLQFLEENRDLVTDYVNEKLPGLQTWSPEGTYLSWIDCRSADLPVPPQQFFLENARVALNAGTDFGPTGAGFVRLNFACCREVLEEALQRMRAALAAR